MAPSKVSLDDDQKFALMKISSKTQLLFGSYLQSIFILFTEASSRYSNVTSEGSLQLNKPQMSERRGGQSGKVHNLDTFDVPNL
ncbi:hypothetical protein NQ315_013131 [Exocentrus adspersus]|uniref:Uncharacterized protein n=1 Tax=Exocentrus adspersus TaxID=1586481 RepID=A0AAV8VWN8_9CUCU|nr:hypothetical protein NQ315_013131 [Exocentrus adspersus]